MQAPSEKTKLPELLVIWLVFAAPSLIFEAPFSQTISAFSKPKKNLHHDSIATLLMPRFRF